MPEGDSIWLAAQRLRPVLLDHELTGVRSRWPRLVNGLLGERVVSVDTHGKHLLLRLSDASTLRIHLKMTGRWRVFRDGRYPLEDLGLALQTDAGSAVCYRVPDVERIDDRALATHPRLSALGPDVLDEDFDPAEAVARAPDETTVGEVLLDQRVCAGIGNVYRAEVLFMERTSPFQPFSTVSDPERLFARAAKLMRANLRSGPRNTTNLPHLDHWVYGRTRRPCMRCRSRIQSREYGELPRVVYWCPRCQALRD